MGDEITVEKIEIIQGGILQIDFKNETNNKMYRSFIEPNLFFTMLGNAMMDNHRHWEKGCDGCELS